MWRCSNCGERVPETFDICWSCRTAKEAVQDPGHFSAAPAGAIQDRVPDGATGVNRQRGKRKTADRCRACGSRRMIPDVPALASGENDGGVYVVIEGEPDALIFKDRVFESVRAWICGRCGYTEFRVANAPELYRKYRQAMKRKRKLSGEDE